MNIEVGKEVLLVTSGNNARYGVKSYMATITSIGRKWFKVKSEIHHIENEKFSLETGYCDGKGYAPEWRIFENEQEYLETINRPDLVFFLKKEIEQLDYCTLKLVEQLIKEATNV